MNDRPLFGLSQRAPPANIEAEQALLGSILANSARAFPLVEAFLEPKHFADPVHARIFEAAARRCRSGRFVDAVTLKVEFEDDGYLDEVGGTEYLAQLLAASISPLMAAEYGRVVVDAWLRRQMIEIGTTVVDRAFGGDVVDGQLRAALAALEAISTPDCQHKARTMLDAVDAALAQADAVYAGAAFPGIKTGMRAVDEAFGGFENGDLVVLGGRPGSGKSALSWKWAIDVARAQCGVLAISMEMTAAALGRRALSTISGVPIARMRRGEHWADMGALLDARRELSSLPITIEDGGRASMLDIGLMARAAKRRHGLRLIIIDHLQIAKADEGDNRNGSTAAIAGIAHGCKELAKREGCPVILLSQLNRGSVGREDHRPNMGDLRQAGAIEEDADAVAFVHREELYIGKAPPDRGERETDEAFSKRSSLWHAHRAKCRGRAELIIEKLRDGEPTSVPLRFDGPTATFSELENEQ